MHTIYLRPLTWLTIFVMIFASACSQATPVPTQAQEAPVATQPLPTPEPTQAPPTLEPSPVPTESNAVKSLDDLESAVVYIQAEGSLRDPAEGWQVNVGGTGTGFIVDPSGLAITNNHVVTGAATLKVWLAGEDQPRFARVLGASECSDLAVIKIDGNDFPYLEWYQGDIKVGMDVYTAGYPISGAGKGYSLTKGIVSKAKGSVDWTVAAVDQIIEHTAKVNPGNSGGPLVDQNARVVGVNFGYTETLDQNYAVHRDEAMAMFDQLRTGVDVDSLGINGVGVEGDLQGNQVVGIWVRSVKSGSPADNARILPGDIILEVASKVMTDGTLGNYCDVIRSHNPTDTLNVTVLRADTLEIFEGQFNGRELEYVSSLDASGSTGQAGSQDGGGSQGNTSASASGDVYFSTDFDSADNWYPVTVPETENYEAFTESGVMYVEANDTNSNVYLLYDFNIPAPDVRVDASVETVGGPNNNNISLVCRASDAGWYEFSMNSGGYWYIWKYEDGKYTRLTYGASRAINMQKAANSLTATCIGRELTFYVNGVELGSVSDNTFRDGGQVGVSVSTFDVAGAAVEFDWFSASVP